MIGMRWVCELRENNGMLKSNYYLWETTGTMGHKLKIYIRTLVEGPQVIILGIMLYDSYRFF